MAQLLQPLNFNFPMGNLDAYLIAVKKIPLLSEQEEKELFWQWHHEEDKTAVRKIVLAHLRYVVSIAKGYAGYGLQLADLIQEGNIGLIKAVKKFNPEMGVKLASFAVYWIKAEIHEFILKNWRIVKIATTKAQRKLFFKLKSFKQKFGENIPLIAKEMSIKKSTVEEMNARISYEDTDLEAVSHYPAHHADPALLVEAHDEDQANEKLRYAIEKLDDRSRDIIQRRWLQQEEEKKSTLEDLAKTYNVSPERIRQIEKNAFQKLRQAMV